MPGAVGGIQDVQRDQRDDGQCHPEHHRGHLQRASGELL